MYVSLDDHPLVEHDTRSQNSGETDFSIVERRGWYIRDWLHYQFGSVESLDTKVVEFSAVRYTQTGANKG